MQFIRLLPDGRVLTLAPEPKGKARLCLAKGLSRGYFDDEWVYDSSRLAAEMARAWDPESQNEPEGWSFHPFSKRRRPNGDASREFMGAAGAPPPPPQSKRNPTTSF